MNGLAMHAAAPSRRALARGILARRAIARRLLLALGWALIVLALLLGALWATLRAALAPQAGEWATEIGRGPFKLQASVPQLVWLATTPWIGPALNGARVSSRAGPITLGWASAGAGYPKPVLTLRCEPCALPLPAALGQESLTAPALRLALSRDQVQNLRGTLLLEAISPQGERAAIEAQWQARRHGPGWDVTMHWPEAPARHWLALLAPDLPELRVARIEGGVSASARLQWPAGQFELTPQALGLAVSGLGTESWAHAQSSCGPQRTLDANGWLARAVLAAEDQRFYEHPGYDLNEMLASLAANQQHAAIQRGGSTLTQQVAKLMAAGDERTLRRKLRELLYAVEIEQTLGKARILQLYLNQAPWGRAADGRLVCGADAAARHYFGVPAQRLNARQAVTLAAMLHNPDREAWRWASEGSVSPARLTWVAEQIRGVPVRQRRALANRLRAELRPEPALPAAPASAPDAPGTVVTAEAGKSECLAR
ncbi:MAG: transglycosylase domain-containing protein [Desulfovibrionaceae bacterium]|nr:transglycosylase domain-containing protein [Desulfovibrionaceae bacterium]